MADNVPLNIQEMLFWGPRWTKTIETCFVGFIADEAISGMFETGQPTRDAVREALRQMNGLHGESFSMGYVTKRFKVLRTRYNVFKSLCEKSGFSYNHTTGEYVFPDDLYHQCVQQCSLIRAYKHDPEPHWEDLQIIFGHVDPDGASSPDIDPVPIQVVHALPVHHGPPNPRRQEDHIVHWRDDAEQYADNFWSYVSGGSNAELGVADMESSSDDSVV